MHSIRTSWETSMMPASLPDALWDTWPLTGSALPISRHHHHHLSSTASSPFTYCHFFIIELAVINIGPSTWFKRSSLAYNTYYFIFVVWNVFLHHWPRCVSYFPKDQALFESGRGQKKIPQVIIDFEILMGFEAVAFLRFGHFPPEALSVNLLLNKAYLKFME